MDRLAHLERSHADLAQLVASIHEALPPEIAAATGRSLALGSPIDAVGPPSWSRGAPPIIGTPPPPLPERFEPPAAPQIDPFTQTFEAADPWAAPVPVGDSFFQPLAAVGTFPTEAEGRPKRRLFGSRKAAREAQARIAAEFAAPAPPPGFYSSDISWGGDGPPPPPPGFGTASPSSDFGLPSGWGDVPAASGPVHGAMDPAPPPGFAVDYPDPGFAAPPGWFGSAAETPPGPPPPPSGFSADLAEPDVVGAWESDNTSWGAPADLASPTDFVFDQPVVPPPPGFGPPGYEGLSAVPPLEPEQAMTPPPPPGYGTSTYDMGDAPPPPPPGYGPPPDQAMAPPPPPGYGSDQAMPPPPPGYGPPPDQAITPPPPPGYGGPSLVSSDEAFSAVQDVNALATSEGFEPEAEEEEPRYLAGTGTDRTSYASVPPITPDFFARSAHRGGRR
jgi:hypothetical protein